LQESIPLKTISVLTGSQCAWLWSFYMHSSFGEIHVFLKKLNRLTLSKQSLSPPWNI
jgi:hypothetical protein